VEEEEGGEGCKNRKRGTRRKEERGKEKNEEEK
jgi:hypothetical protein